MSEWIDAANLSSSRAFGEGELIDVSYLNGHEWWHQDPKQVGWEFVTKYRLSNKDPAMQEKDPGQHYRKYLRYRVNQDDLDRGFVEIQLDPGQIAEVYPMSAMRFTILKKNLRCGDGNKTYAQDLRDIINAALREIELESERK